MASLDLTVDITNAQILAVGMGRATRPLACATARHVLDALSYGAGQIAARKLSTLARHPATVAVTLMQDARAIWRRTEEGDCTTKLCARAMMVLLAMA